MDVFKFNEEVSKKTYLTSDFQEICKWFSEGRNVYRKDKKAKLDFNTDWYVVNPGDKLSNDYEYTVDDTPNFKEVTYMDFSDFDKAWDAYKLPTYEVPGYDCWGRYDPSYRTDKKQMAKDWVEWSKKWNSL